jgi:hypothetical protein
LLKNNFERNKSLIIYFGGNADEVSGMVPFYKRFPEWSLLLVNYRGYGISTGKPSQAALCSDALILFDTITKNLFPQIVIVMGRSLGTGVAVHLAAHRSQYRVLF